MNPRSGRLRVTFAAWVGLSARALITVPLQEFVESPFGSAGFGNSLAANGDGTIIAVPVPGLNASRGGVFVYSQGLAPQLIALNADDPRTAFGVAVSVSRDGVTLAVGSNSSDGGTVSMFTCPAAAVCASTSTLSLAGLGGGPSDCFGCALALSANASTVVVGARGHAVNGAVFVYSKGAIIPSTTLRDEDYSGTFPLMFGWAVAVSNDGRVIAIGAPQPCCGSNPESAGRVYTARCDGAGRCGAPAMVPNLEIKGAYVGSVLALSGNGEFLAMGAFGRQQSQGAVFTCLAAACEQPDLLLLTDRVSDDKLGCALALSDDGALLVAGASGRDNVGAAFVFACAPATGTCSQDARVEVTGGPAMPANSAFGSSVALGASGGALVVGAWGGVFSSPNISSFIVSASPSPSPSPAPSPICSVPCSSGICAPGNGACCASPNARHEFDCDPADGSVTSCVKGFDVSIDGSTCGVAPGAGCSRDLDCASLACRNGYCCDPQFSTSCTACRPFSGVCGACDPGTTLNSGICGSTDSGDRVESSVATYVAVFLACILAVVCGVGALLRIRSLRRRAAALQNHPIPFMLAERAALSIGDFDNGVGMEWANMCECILRELALLNPGVPMDEWEPDSSKMRQLVVLMSNALMAFPGYQDRIYRLPNNTFGDFVFGAPRCIQFAALHDAQRGAHGIALAISSSKAWAAMLRDREIPLVEALRRAAGERFVGLARYIEPALDPAAEDVKEQLVPRSLSGGAVHARHEVVVNPVDPVVSPSSPRAAFGPEIN